VDKWIAAPQQAGLELLKKRGASGRVSKWMSNWDSHRETLPGVASGDRTSKVKRKER
jgi:hypothetical protein